MNRKNRARPGIFSGTKPVIGCIHLLPLPGSPLYSGDREGIYQEALRELAILEEHGIDAVIVENFRDVPFYPDNVPPVTVAAMSAVCRELSRAAHIPLGVNVLRNDAEAAVSIAAAAGLDFVRVNVHAGAMITDQGLIQSRAFETLRLRRSLDVHCLIFADLSVKHAVPVTPTPPEVETRDLCERGLADAVIISGSRTGAPADSALLHAVKAASSVPVLMGSGCSDETLENYIQADGFIVGSTFKKEGIAGNAMDPDRVRVFMDHFRRVVRGGKP